jgi:Tfp pilus assembly protein FimT
MRSTSAYTLIELLVAVTIGVIVFTVGIAGYREFSRRQNLTGVAKNLTSDLRTIQQLALTGQKPADVTCDRLIGYTFNRIDSSSYSLLANCDNTRVTGSLSNIEIKTVNFSEEINLSATRNTILFKVLGNGTDLTVDNVITLSNNVSGDTVSITIGTGGDIK